MTTSAPGLAGATADEAAIAFADLPLHEDAARALEDLELLQACVQELRERLATGTFDADAQWDLGLDLFDAANRVHTFALAVQVHA